VTDDVKDYVFESIWKKNGQPGFLFLDLRPVVQPMLLVCSHEIAEQVTRPTKTQPYSVTKSPTLGATFRRIIGDMPIQTENGESWKTLRKRFNPGFAPGHLLSLLPVVIDKTYIFMEKLDALAASGRATELESFCANVTFDIIGEVVTNIDCKTQDDAGQDNDIVRTFRVLSATYVGESGVSLSVQNARRTYTDTCDPAASPHLDELPPPYQKIHLQLSIGYRREVVH
jgi:cytochrome P450